MRPSFFVSGMNGLSPTYRCLPVVIYVHDFLPFRHDGHAGTPEHSRKRQGASSAQKAHLWYRRGMTPVKEIIAEMKDASEEDKALVEKAYAFAENAHKDDKRYSGEPYFVHPSATAKILAELGMDAPTIAAGLMHDAIEDGKASAETVKQEFGDVVLFLVEGVTKLGKHKYRGAERHAESLRRLLVATSADVRVLIIKLADRYHNMTTIEHVPQEKQKRIALETLEI